MNEPSMKAMRAALRQASVEGRSKVKTRAELEELCEQHALLPLPASSSDEEVADLPDDVLRLLCDVVAENAMAAVEKIVSQSTSDAQRARAAKSLTTEARTLRSLGRAARVFRDAIAPKWRGLLRSLAVADWREAMTAEQRVGLGLLDAERAVLLLAGTGCQLCGAQRVRKVRWPFRVRCCQPCLHARTISDYRARERFGLTDLVERGLPHTRVQMYAPRVGAYDLRFLWADDVLRLLRELHPGAEMADLDAAEEHLTRAARAAYEHENRAKLAEERDRHARNELMFAAVLRETRTLLEHSSPAALEIASLTDLRDSSAAFARACLRPTHELHATEFATSRSPAAFARCYAASLVGKQRSRVAAWVRNLASDVTDWAFPFPGGRRPSSLRIHASCVARTTAWIEEHLVDAAAITSPKQLRDQTFKGALRAAAEHVPHADQEEERFAASEAREAAARAAMLAPYTRATFDAETSSFTCGCGRRDLCDEQALRNHARDKHGL